MIQQKKALPKDVGPKCFKCCFIFVVSFVLFFECLRISIATFCTQVVVLFFRCYSVKHPIVYTRTAFRAFYDYALQFQKFFYSLDKFLIDRSPIPLSNIDFPYYRSTFYIHYTYQRFSIALQGRSMLKRRCAPTPGLVLATKWIQQLSIDISIDISHYQIIFIGKPICILAGLGKNFTFYTGDYTCDI